MEDARNRDNHHINPLDKLSWGNHVRMVEYLLGMPPFEAHLRHVNSQGQNVFHAAASRHCNPAIFRLLVSRFPAGMYQQDNDGRTPLDLVMMSVYDGRPEAQRSCSQRMILVETIAPHDE